jgi:hypothetical protein
MKTIVSCPECRRDLQVPDELLGRSVQCPDCKHPFVAQSLDAPIPVTSVSKVPAPAPPAAIPAVAPPAMPTGRDEPSRQAESRRRDEDERDDDLDELRVGRRMHGGAPDRGGVILALGIVSLVLAFFSFMLYILPIWLIPLVVGVFGWILGQRDLRAMREGRMDSSNHVMTLVGMILSIVGVGISACIAILGCGVAAFIALMFSIAAMAPPPGPPPRRF